MTTRKSLRKQVGVLFLALTELCGCNNSATKSPDPTSDNSNSKVRIVAQAASSHGLKEKYLLAAAFVQSNFGLDAGEKAQSLPDSERTAVFGLTHSDLKKGGLTSTGDSALAEQANYLADKVMALAKERDPKVDFDWYVLVAQSIVGDAEPDPNLHDFSVKIVLSQLISAHNLGFTVLLPNSERTVIDPATDDEKIEIKKLDQGQLRFVSGFKFTSDSIADAVIKGEQKAEIEIKDGKDFPKITLRMCTANPLVCFDHLRKSENSSAHFLTYKGLNGNNEIIQVHDIKKDLNFYGKAQKNNVTIVISRLPGLSLNTSRLDFMDWEDYVAVRKSVFAVLAQIGRVLNKPEFEPKFHDSSFLNSQVIEAFKDDTSNAEIPADKPNFFLPDIWDKNLFREILSATHVLRDVSQFRVETPQEAQVFAGTEATFAFYPDRDSAVYEIYQDNSKKVPGAPWDLILKQDFNPSQERYELNREFRYPGLTGDKVRAVKFVARTMDGKIIGSHVVRFRMDGIATPQ